MSKHDRAIQAFQQRELKLSLQLFEELLRENESSELWNDWATVQATAGQVAQAESGLLRALELDPENHPAQADLSILLLGRGEYARAIPLIQECLLLLPAQQQEVLRLALQSLAAGSSMRILVIHDSLPQLTFDGPEEHLPQVLRALQELGHSVTLVARDARKRDQSFHDSGATIFAGDVERLAALGIQIEDPGWRIERVLADGNFDVAFLTQNFDHGISIPEHYLHAIRRHSPQTRIAILGELLHGVSAAARAQVSGELRHGELAEDWKQREWETFRRADLVLVSNPHDACILRAEQIPVAVTPCAFDRRASAKNDRKRSGILFAGNLEQTGPRDGLLWFIEQVLPQMESKTRRAGLTVVGSAVPRDLQKKLSGVKWAPAEQLGALLEGSSLFISPQRFGAPSPYITEMLCAGLPGVLTSFAENSSGIAAGFLVADTSNAFAAATVRVLEEQQLWENLHAEALLAASGSSWETAKEKLSHALLLLAHLTPQPLPKESFSITLVDSLYSQLLNQTSGEKRVYARLDFYIQLAEQLVRHGKFLMAREQLRHIFGWLGDSIKLAPALAQPLGLLKRCYRQLGDDAMAEGCGEEARRCFTMLSNSAAAHAPAIRRTKNQPLISLIVPTYNRRPILKKCLAALEAQTARPQDFEVIVIDDGSSDGSEEFMREYRAPFPLKSLRQTNSGTGTARRHGVEHATGEYLLLMNDDTICDPGVVEEHLKAQKKYSAQKWAVLGDFEYPEEARKRALTHFFRVNSFMFPQVDMERGCPYGYSHFITCNLSIRREAVLQVGSFDGTYMLSEDTEMGIKLFELGYSVVYHPAAHAWHDHVQYTMPNLLRRARIYGGDYFHMFRRHPRVMREWAMPIQLTAMDPENGFRIRAYVDQHRPQIKAAVAALERWDKLDFEPILANPENERHVLSLFQQSVPAVHWFHLFERMLEVMAEEFRMPDLVSAEPLALPAAAQ